MNKNNVNSLSSIKVMIMFASNLTFIPVCNSSDLRLSYDSANLIFR